MNWNGPMYKQQPSCSEPEALSLVFNDVFVLQSFNNDRNSRGAFFSFGLSVLNAFNCPIHVTARFWNDTFHKNTDEGFALSTGLPDSVHDNRLKGSPRYQLSFRWHRAVAEYGELQIAIVLAVYPSLRLRHFDDLWVLKKPPSKANL
jgi:hypothetical protein